MLLEIAGRQFRPTWLPTLATLVLLPVLIGLGLWQWQRAEQKQDLQQAYQARLEQPAIALQALSAPAEELYRQVSASGYYDDAQQILLDNQIHKGQAGYLVYTPLRLDDTQNKAILVNRGWIAMSADRELPLPLIAALQEGLVRVIGRLGRPPNPGILLDNPNSGIWPKVVQHIDYEELSQALGYDLETAVILLDPAEPNGFLRDWNPTFGGFGPERHIGYAVQWFALAATLLVIYFVMNLKRSSNRKT